MSRSGYTYDDDWDGAQWANIRWRGALKSAIRGKKGQAFLKELLAALDAMPEKRLIAERLVIDGNQDSDIGGQYSGVQYPQLIVGADELVATDGTVAAMGDVCALGALGRARGLKMDEIDPDDPPSVAAAFEVNEKIAAEIAYRNDEVFDYHYEKGGRRPYTPEERWKAMRDWVAKQIWEWKEIDE